MQATHGLQQRQQPRGESPSIIRATATTITFDQQPRDMAEAPAQPGNGREGREDLHASDNDELEVTWNALAVSWCIIHPAGQDGTIGEGWSVVSDLAGNLNALSCQTRLQAIWHLKSPMAIVTTARGLFRLAQTAKDCAVVKNVRGWSGSS